MPFRLAKFMMFGACPIAIVLGSWVLTEYSYRPGAQVNVVKDLHSAEEVSEFFASDSATQLDATTLIVFFHPHCPCTKSTIRNLERLVTKFSRQTQMVAFGFCPANESDSWMSSPTTSALLRLNAKVIADKDGKYCCRFGPRTSGHILVYGIGGGLLFSGGITPGRGHEGDCLASADLTHKINGRSGDVTHWPVYGCPIVKETERQP